MLKIIIDASDRKLKKIQLIQTVSGIESIIAEKQGDIDIVSEIKNLVQQNKLTLNKIDSFDYEDGEGSFTGIKTAAAIANILQWAVRNKEISDIKLPKYNSEPNISSPKEKRP